MLSLLKTLVNGYEICNLLAEGLRREDAWVLADVSESTFYEWMKTKEEFSEAIKKAELFSKQYHIGVIRKASKKYWQASAWFLERKFKDEFSALQKLDHSGSMRLDHDDLRAKIAALPADEQKSAYAFLAKLFAQSNHGGKTQKSAA